MSSSSTVPVTQSSSIQHIQLPTAEGSPLAYRQPEILSISTSEITTPVTSLTTSSEQSPSLARINMTITKTPAMMPACGEKGAPPKFKGSYEEVKRFLQRYNDITTIYNATPAQKCERVIDYCSPKVRQLVESLKSYSSKDWDALEQDFLRYYDANRRDTRYIIRDLSQLTKVWKHRSIKSLTEWKRYERKFITIAGWLHAKNKIGDDEQSAYFWHGINKKLRNIIENRLLMQNPRPSITQAFPMSSVINIAEQLFERDRFDYNLADSDTDLPDWNEVSAESSDEDSSSDSDQESYQRIKQAKRNRKKHKTRNHSDSDGPDGRNGHTVGLSLTRTLKEPLESLKHDSEKMRDPKGKSPLSRNTNSFQQQNNVEQLIKQLGRMSLTDPQYSLIFYKAIKLDPAVSRCVPPPNLQRSQPSKIQTVGMSTVKSGVNPGGQPRETNRASLTCYGCGEAGHGLRECPQILELVNNGVVSKDRFGRIAFPDGTPVQRIMGETIVQAISRRQTAVTHFVEISNLSEYYQSDSEDQEVDVLAAEKGPKLITKARKAVFDGVAVPRSSWKGKENIVPMTNSTVQSQAKIMGNKKGPFTRSQGPSGPVQSVPSPSAAPAPQQIIQIPVDVRQPRQQQIPEVQMRDIPAGKSFPEDKLISKAKMQTRQSQVSAQVGEFQVVNSILNTPITLKVGEVLATSKGLVEQLASMIKLKNVKAPSPSPQTLFSAKDPAFLIKLPMECDGRQVSAILDTGSQVNIVSKRVSEQIIRRPVNSNFTATMKDANGGAGRLVGKIDNVPLRCGGVLTNATLFVGQQLPFDLLLGRPWQRNNLVSIEERINGTYVVFRNHERPSLTCELLVEEQIPKPFYLLDNSWPEELVENESWPTELIDKNEVDVALMTLDEPTESTEEGTSTTKDTGQIRPSQHLAAVKSEFEMDSHPAVSAKWSQMKLLVMTANKPAKYVEGKTQQAESITNTRARQYVAAVKSEFENNSLHAEPGNWGLGLDWPDFKGTQTQIQTHKGYFRKLIPSWDTMGKVISKYITKSASSPKSTTISNFNPKCATMENPIPSWRTIAIDKPIFNDTATDNPNSSWRTITIDNPISNDMTKDNPISDWRIITIDNPISNDMTKDNTSSNWRTMDISTPNHATMDNSIPASKSNPILFTEDRDKLRQFIDPQKWKWNEWTAYKQDLISKCWNKISHPLTPASLTTMASDSLSFLQALPLVYHPNSIPPPESIASHDPFMGRADQYRCVASLQHLLDLLHRNQGMNSSTGMITSPQVVRYETQQVHDRRIEKGAFLHASLIHMDSNSNQTIPSVQHGHLYYIFVKDPMIHVPAQPSIPPIVTPPSSVVESSNLHVNPSPLTQSPAQLQSLPSGANNGEARDGSTMETQDCGHFQVLATLVDPFPPTSALGEPDPYIPPIFLNFKSYAGESKDGVEHSPLVVEDSIISDPPIQSPDTIEQKMSVRQLGASLMAAQDKGKQPEIASPLPEESGDCKTPLGNFTIRIKPPIFNYDPAVSVRRAQTAIRTGGPPPLSSLSLPRLNWQQESLLSPVITSVSATPQFSMEPPSDSLLLKPIYEIPGIEMASPATLALLEESLEGVDNLKVFPTSVLSESQLDQGSCNPQHVFPDPLPQETPTVMEHPPITTLDDHPQLAPPCKRRRCADETEDLEEGESVDSSEEDSGRSKRQRSHSSHSSEDDEVSHHSALDEWDVPQTGPEHWGAETEEALQQSNWEEASSSDSDSDSDLSVSSSEVEKEWKEFQEGLAEALVNASSTSTSPPPLEPIGESSEEQLVVSPDTFDPKDFEFLMPSQKVPPRPPSRPPSRDHPFISAFFPPAHTFFYPPDQLWYEIKTDQIDGWEYADAATYVPRPHGADPVAPSRRKFCPAPSGHPVWCEANKLPVFRFHTSTVYIGQHDNHPLRKWENHITPGVTNSHTLPDKFDTMAIPFQQAHVILAQATLSVEDWNDIPESVSRDEVQESIRLHKACYSAIGASLMRFPFGNQMKLDKSHIVLGNSSVISPHESELGAISEWKKYPMGAPSYSPLVTSFANPYLHPDKDIAFNAWNPRITELRRARAYILQGIRAITLYLLQPNLRRLIDNYKDDTNHFFYKHCHIFRFLDASVDPLQQGFTCQCLHMDYHSTLFPPPVREPFSTRNPILSVEEDEFLHHAAKIFEHLGKEWLTKQIRLVRAINPFMADRISLLFKSGHVDMYRQFDENGHKWPLLWDTGELKF